MPRIHFQPAGVSIEVASGSNIRDAGINAGVEIPSTCGGVGSCGLCKVKITSGAECLGEMTEVELNKLGNVFFITKERLSCQTIVGDGDVACEVPEETRAKAKKVQLRKDAYGARAPRDERAPASPNPGGFPRRRQG